MLHDIIQFHYRLKFTKFSSASSKVLAKTGVFERLCRKSQKTASSWCLLSALVSNIWNLVLCLDFRKLSERSISRNRNCAWIEIVTILLKLCTSFELFPGKNSPYHSSFWHQLCQALGFWICTRNRFWYFWKIPRKSQQTKFPAFRTFFRKSVSNTLKLESFRFPALRNSA